MYIYQLTTARILLLGFFAVILLGTLLLLLPISTKQGKRMNAKTYRQEYHAYYLAAEGDNHNLSCDILLFTATSATCVTGLSVAPTAGTFTVFGQIIILALIQVGGLGFMTITSFFYSYSINETPVTDTMSKPALQKAEMLWNMPNQSDLPKGIHSR